MLAAATGSNGPTRHKSARVECMAEDTARTMPEPVASAGTVPGAAAAAQLALDPLRSRWRRPAAPARKRRAAPGRCHPRPRVLRAHHPLRLPHRPRRYPGDPSAAAEHHLAGDGRLRRRCVRRDDRAGAAGSPRTPLGARARYRAERGRRRGGERDPRPAARQPRRKTGRNRDPRLLRDVPGPPDRSFHGGRRGRIAVSGAGPATPHRGLHRAGGSGLSRRRSRAAGQRPRQPGHRLGGNGGGPAHLWLPARPPVGR